MEQALSRSQEAAPARGSRPQEWAELEPQALRGRILRLRAAGDPRLRYDLYLPREPRPRAALFVCVHGISRNGGEHARRFAPLAERYGVTLVAPRFPAGLFPDYQRLGRSGRRADQALDRVVSDVRRLTGMEGCRLSLFGYSGGGQFVHRYAMAYPQRVDRVVVAAAGWYTFPDREVAFPRGIGSSARLPGVRFQPRRFLMVPACVLVGDRDHVRDADLRTSRSLDRQQGETRLERGARWAAAMAAAARRGGLPTPYRFATLPGIDHSFRRAMRRGGLGRATFEFLFEEDGSRAPEAVGPDLDPNGSRQ